MTRAPGCPKAGWALSKHSPVHPQQGLGTPEGQQEDPDPQFPLGLPRSSPGLLQLSWARLCGVSKPLSLVSALETEVLSPPDHPKPPVPISSLTGGMGAPAEPSSAQLLQPRAPHRDHPGHFHAQPGMCSVLPCIPEEQLLSRAEMEEIPWGVFFLLVPAGTIV